MWFEESLSNLRLAELVEEWRDLWAYKGDFVVAAMSYVFAMTNFLNMPKLILDNGGLAFVSAYGVSLVVCILPTIVAEMAVGQLTGRAPVLAFFNLCPAFKGVGVSQMLFTLVVLACMTKFVGWLLVFLYYLFWTLQASRPGLPWLNCKNFPEFLSFPCREAGQLGNFSHASHTRLNAVQAESSLMQFMTSVERATESIDSFGEFQLEILIAQAAVWILVFFAICCGVRFLGKFVACTLVIAFVTLLGLFMTAAVSGGFEQILVVYWNATDWTRLYDYQMWKLAVEQSILATGIGFGVFITMSSYNKRDRNVVCNALTIIVWHAFITAMQVLTVIGFVGVVAHKTGLQASELLDKGESQMWHMLAYASYLAPYQKVVTGVVLVSAVCVLLNVLNLMSFSLLSTCEDALGERWSRCFPRFVLSLFVCALCFAMSLYFATQAGRHAYELATGFIKYITIFVILGVELLAIAWFYCAHRLGKDLHSMLHYACCWCLGHFLLLFTYFLPVVPIAIAVLNARDYSFESFSPPIHAWEWSEYAGAAIAVVPLVPIVLYFICSIFASCCCPGEHAKGVTSSFATRLHPTANEKTHPPRYTTNAPGYLLLPQAPLAEPEYA